MRHEPDFRRARRTRPAPVTFWPAPKRRRRTPVATIGALAVAIGLAVGVLSVPDIMNGDDAMPPSSIAATGRFTLCHSGGGTNCVVDGDTIWIAGEKVRIADIDTPETHPPRCPAEAELGDRATRRLQALLNAGPIELAAADRPTDRYGRRLAIVTRDGVSLGDTLIDEGLARPWEGRRRPWC